jgi:hypothetical protein
MAAIPDFNIRDEFQKSETTLWVTVKVVRDWRFKLGFAIVRFGTWLMGMMCKIKEED